MSDMTWIKINRYIWALWAFGVWDSNEESKTQGIVRWAEELDGL